jgi:hypothetical protein
MNSNPQDKTGSKLKQALTLLEQNPTAPSLLSNAALLAFDAGEVSLCRDLIERLASVSPRSAQLEHLRGLLAFAHGRLPSNIR